MEGNVNFPTTKNNFLHKDNADDQGIAEQS